MSVQDLGQQQELISLAGRQRRRWRCPRMPDVFRQIRREETLSQKTGLRQEVGPLEEGGAGQGVAVMNSTPHGELEQMWHGFSGQSGGVAQRRH